MSASGPTGGYPPEQPPPVPPSSQPPEYYAQAEQKTSGLAIASLVLGISSFACLGPLCGIPAIITGHIALSKTRGGPHAPGGMGMAIAGLVLGYANILVMMLALMTLPIMLPALARAREAARRASCANNMKQVGLVFKMFASEHGGEFPELSSEPGRLMFANEGSDAEYPVFPEYLTDLSILFCPSDVGDVHLLEDSTDPDRLIDDQSYFYLGYVVMNDVEVQAFAEAYRERISRGLKFDQDLDVPEGTGTGGGNRILRLIEGVERSGVTDTTNAAASAMVQSSMPILIERPENHIPGGGNVLFMDGHVEFVKYPGQWPMTETTIRTLESLDTL